MQCRAGNAIGPFVANMSGWGQWNELGILEMPGASHDVYTKRYRGTMCWLALITNLLLVVPALADPVTTRHFAANNNFDVSGHFAPGTSGFNLADVSQPRQLDLLPAGVEALVWIGRCGGVTDEFKSNVSAFIGHPGVFGYYLMDDPDPTGRFAHRCSADDLRTESDWIHSVAPNARTFVMLMNQGPSYRPAYDTSYRPEVTHVDLFGISPYPCRSERAGCDFGMIADYVAAAESAGIPRANMVPTYQTFGGGNWRNDDGGRYRLPTVRLARKLLAHWGRLLKHPVFDYAYSWGVQRDDQALENAPALRMLMAIHNTHATARGSGD